MTTSRNSYKRPTERRNRYTGDRPTPPLLAPALTLSVVSSTKRNGAVTAVMALSHRGKITQTLHLQRRGDLFYTTPTGIAERQYAYTLSGATLTRLPEATIETRPALPNRKQIRANRFMRALRRVIAFLWLLAEMLKEAAEYHFPPKPARTQATITRDLADYAPTTNWIFTPKVGDTGIILRRDGTGAWINFDAHRGVATYIPNRYFRAEVPVAPAPALVEFAAVAVAL